MSRQKLVVLLCAAAAALLSGCASNPKDPKDPMEDWNRRFYDFNDSLDSHVMKPASNFYQWAVPKPARQCLSNAFDNLGYFNVILNDLLQEKDEQFRSDAFRMAINSTVGLGGLLDPATGWGMPKHDTDFGLTLAKWGEDEGTYMVLPLVGPTTMRDGWGLAVQVLTDPLMWFTTPIAVDIGMQGATMVDYRTRLDTEIKFRDRNAMDAYIFTREAYLQHRRYLVNQGKPQQAKDADLEKQLLDVLEGDLDAANPGSGGAKPGAAKPTKPSTQTPPAKPAKPADAKPDPGE